MKLYFAGVEQKNHLQKFLKAGGERGLVVLWELLDKDLSYLKESVKDLFVDSGAFSAFTRNVEIDIKKYCKVIKKYNFKTYANLDVIGNHEASAKNQAYMESQGLKPIPTFHYGTDYSILEEMYKKHDYIAFGGLVPLSRKKTILESHLNKCFGIVKNNVKVHGFGVNAYSLLIKYPFYSVDATSWLSGEKRGSIINKDNTYTKCNNKDDIIKNNINLKQFVDSEDGLKYKNRSTYNVKKLIETEKYITRLWEKRGVAWQN